MDELSTPDYEFGGYRLETARQRLVAPSGEPIALPSRAFDTLRFLVERAGELVEKADLMRAVWPKTVVEENNLSQCISTLRRALGEEAGERRFILTVPGRGFKFTAPVRVVPRSTASGALAPPPEPAPLRLPETAPSARSRRLGWPLLAGAAALLALAAIATSQLLARHGPVTSSVEYVALTDLAESATAPAISADGRLLAYISGGDPFLSAGQLWLKVLPDGEPIRLAHSSGPIFAPTFTADGTHVAYTQIEDREVGNGWDTWVVPITGGTPVKLLPNASGLTFIGRHEVMYSEFKSGIHLGIVTSLDDRSKHRDIYLPTHERAMAHYSYLSPDRKSVLVVEMGRRADWQRCRLVPFDGSSAGVQVGPEGACHAAGWSPDGRWMYFEASHDGHSHLWRQRFPDGEPEQLTFGPADEETLAVAPDGRSLLTSLGRLQATVWLHDASGERALTTESLALRPTLSADGRHVYFLAASPAQAPTALWRLEVASGRKESLLAGFKVGDYSVSRDERLIVFTTAHEGVPEIWVAPVDRASAPRLLVRNADQPALDGSSRIYYRRLGEQRSYLHRVQPDGSGDEQLLATPIVDLQAVSPNGEWVAAALSIPGHLAGAHLVPLNGGEPYLLAAGWFPSCWSWDGKLLYAEAGTNDSSQNHGRTVVLPLQANGLPAMPMRPVPAGATVIPHAEVDLGPGPDPSVYVYVKVEQRRNIYRIPLHS